VGSHRVLFRTLSIMPPVPHSRSPRLWGTFSASGGAGATTLTLHLARIATRLGQRVLIVESDIRAPLREILGAAPPFWEEYRRTSALVKAEALPQNLRTGFALLTRRSSAPISEEIFIELCTVAAVSYTHLRAHET
jgi:Mrp family chromosome partitioning ATPase